MFGLIDLDLAPASTFAIAQGAAPDIPWLRILGAFAFCITLAVAAIVFLRWRQGLPVMPNGTLSRTGTGSRSVAAHDQLAIIQRLGLGPGSQFIVLERGEQCYLLHVSQQGVTEIDRYLTSPDLKEEGRP